MKLARLRQLRDSLPIIEVEQEFLFAATVLVHIERLPSVRVLAKKSWAMSDMFEAIFECRGHRFLMQLPFGCIVIAATDVATPCEVIDELVAHLDNYRTVWPTQLRSVFLSAVQCCTGIYRGCAIALFMPYRSRFDSALGLDCQAILRRDFVAFLNASETPD